MLLINQLSLAMTTLAGLADVISGAVMVLFFISAVLVILVVLAQEGKGGGLAGAFGGAGAESFGVKAGTVNKFTAWLAASFLGLALLHAGLSSYTKEEIGKPDIGEFSEDTDAEDANPPAVEPAGGDKKPSDGKKPANK